MPLGLLQLFFQLGPAGEELVHGGGGLLEFRLGGDEGGSIALNAGIVEHGLGDGETGFGEGNFLLDGGVLASFLVGEFFLGGRGGGAGA